jgi:ribosomal-protein-serine acetyltransferase
MFKYQVNEDIYLTLIEHRHAEEFFQLMVKNRDYIGEWLSFVYKVNKVEDTIQFIESTLKKFSQNNGLNTCIWYKGEIAGTIGLHFIDWNNKKTEIGYWLGKEFSGKGIMTESCRALLHYVFDELKLNRVEIRAIKENTKSRAIPEKLGFKEEGILRQSAYNHGHPVNSIVYGIIRDEWKGDLK